MNTNNKKTVLRNPAKRTVCVGEIINRYGSLMDIIEIHCDFYYEETGEHVGRNDCRIYDTKNACFFIPELVYNARVKSVICKPTPIDKLMAIEIECEYMVRNL